MTLYQIAMAIGLAGAVGGIVASLLSGERNFLPRYEEGVKIPRMGWLGNVFIGAIAALVVWAVYGPLASFDLIQGDISKTSLPLFLLGSSVVVGISGGKILTTMAQQQSDKIARDNLAKALEALAKNK
jgi:hypothetical protein